MSTKYKTFLILGIVIAAASWLGAIPAIAAAAESDTNQPVPRFAALRSDRVNLRTGPGQRYPIEWVYTRKDMPVEVVAQYEHWRQVRDWQGTQGWVQEHLLIGKREVIITGGIKALQQRPDAGSSVVARVEPGVIAKLVECQGAWCQIDANGSRGWLHRTDIWGVYPDETVP